MYKYLILLSLLISCSKNEEITENNLQAKGLYPQNPMPPQIEVYYPKATWVDSPCPGYIWQQICCDTLNLSFKVIAGRKASGSPDKLTKYRIVIDNVIVEEKTISGTSFQYLYVAKIPIPSMNVFDTTYKKWHSVGLSAWQSDGNIASNGQYIYR